MRIEIGLVALVESDEDRHFRFARLPDRLVGLGPDSFVACDDEDDDVGDVGAARAHFRERFVSWSVENRHLSCRRLYFERADVLRDGARLSGDSVGFSDRVDQARFAVVDVTHERNDRGAKGDLLLSNALDFLPDRLAGDPNPLLLRGVDFDIAPEVVAEELDNSFVIEVIVESQRHSLHQELGDQLRGFEFHLLGEVFDRDRKPDRKIFRTNDLFLDISLWLIGSSFAPGLIVDVAEALPVARVKANLFFFLLRAEFFWPVEQGP